MKVLITGGAGFIGSTVASACLDAGITPVVLDNTVTGRAEFAEGRIFYRGDIADGALLDRVFAEHPDIAATVHCAALAVVPDSVADPLAYYQVNVTGTLELVRHLLRNHCRRLLFSSSASVYRPGADFTVDEDSPFDPQSPYARTKAICEQLLADVAAAEPLRVLSLRYFNPIGADPALRTGLQLPRPNHALGRLIQSWQRGEPFLVTGTDYPTRDGSGLRDYVHVWDLARAHVAALTRFDLILPPATTPAGTAPAGTASTATATAGAGADAVGGSPATSLAVNLGTETGTTVTELVRAFNALVDRPVTAVPAPRRPGDVAGARTRSDRARTLLGWEPALTLADGIRDSLRWAEVRPARLADRS
ncbi:NAD-dependent epimerase/dehydratase family protein [Kitasatospora sp. NPDC088391]|uniref:NAD-dependent epimerase/dehydratase family protein n=1 Tax=Kitasatospora sp. NPDC088391 TaxID=3364074 RepID=UPI0038184123